MVDEIVDVKDRMFKASEDDAAVSFNELDNSGVDKWLTIS